MMKNIEVLKNSAIFKNIDEKDIEAMLNCLSARERKFKKGENILSRGDIVENICFIVEGVVHIVKEDFWGNESIFAEVSKGQLFGEAYACIGNVPFQMNVVAIKDCVILELNIDRVLRVCSESCKFHSMLIKNLISVVAGKNIVLASKIDCVSQRSIRDKIMTYLSLQSQKRGSNRFEIPFNRQQMADYLATERSALSKELGKMREEGIIEFRKNMFWLK